MLLMATSIFRRNSLGGMEHVSDSHQKAIPNLTTRINYINHIRLTIQLIQSTNGNKTHFAGLL